MLQHIADIHTHRLDAPAGQAVINLPDTVLSGVPFSFREGALYSVGIHPMYPGDWEQAFHAGETLAQRPEIVAVGECGLDKLSPVALETQQDCFSRHIALACQLQKPLIIHCVRAWDELLQTLRRSPAGVTCIVHAFRGKPQLAQQLLRAGLYLSFGPRFNADSLRLCPPDRRCAETDDSGLPVEAVLQSHSEALKRMQS
jgi:TatD DNase family protein